MDSLHQLAKQRAKERRKKKQQGKKIDSSTSAEEKEQEEELSCKHLKRLKLSEANEHESCSGESSDEDNGSEEMVSGDGLLDHGDSDTGGDDDDMVSSMSRDSEEHEEEEEEVEEEEEEEIEEEKVEEGEEVEEEEEEEFEEKEGEEEEKKDEEEEEKEEGDKEESSAVKMEDTSLLAPLGQGKVKGQHAGRKPVHRQLPDWIVNAHIVENDIQGCSRPIKEFSLIPPTLLGNLTAAGISSFFPVQVS